MKSNPLDCADGSDSRDGDVDDVILFTAIQMVLGFFCLFVLSCACVVNLYFTGKKKKQVGVV